MTMIRRLWQKFWAWFTTPMPFPRDHWFRPKAVILWDEFNRDGDRESSEGDEQAPTPTASTRA
jgi:hypothetical protein